MEEYKIILEYEMISIMLAMSYGKKKVLLYLINIFHAVFFVVNWRSCQTDPTTLVKMKELKKIRYYFITLLLPHSSSSTRKNTLSQEFMQSVSQVTADIIINNS